MRICATLSFERQTDAADGREEREKEDLAAGTKLTLKMMSSGRREDSEGGKGAIFK